MACPGQCLLDCDRGSAAVVEVGEKLVEEDLRAYELIAQRTAQTKIVGQTIPQLRASHDAPPGVLLGQGLASTCNAKRSTFA